MIPIESPEVTLERIAYTWSFSKYKAYKTCNEKYAFEYLMRLRPEISQRPFFHGNIAHETIEKGFEAFKAGTIVEAEFPDWIRDNVGSVIETQVSAVKDWTGPDDVERATAEALQLTDAYVKLVLENKLLTEDTICEYAIGTFKRPMILDNGLRMTGYIDWLKIENNVGYVLDAKTSRSFQYIDRDQLVFYAICAEHQFKVPVERVAWMMIRQGKTYWYDVTRDEKDRLLGSLLGASHTVMKADLTSFPSFNLCRDCAFTEKCISHRNWLISPDLGMEIDL